jgi:hypothetical protein
VLFLFFLLSRSEMLLSTTTSWGFAGWLFFVVCVCFGLQSGCAIYNSEAEDALQTVNLAANDGLPVCGLAVVFRLCSFYKSLPRVA